MQSSQQVFHWMKIIKMSICCVQVCGSWAVRFRSGGGGRGLPGHAAADGPHPFLSVCRALPPGAGLLPRRHSGHGQPRRPRLLQQAPRAGPDTLRVEATSLLEDILYFTILSLYHFPLEHTISLSTRTYKFFYWSMVSLSTRICTSFY